MNIEAHPVFVVEEALKCILNQNEGDKIPLASYERARGKLKKLGATLLLFLKVKLPREGGEYDRLVPVRITDDPRAATRLGHVECYKVWHGREILNLSLAQFKEMDAVVRKVKDFILTAANRLVHKIQRIICRERYAEEKCLRKNYRKRFRTMKPPCRGTH